MDKHCTQERAIGALEESARRQEKAVDKLFRVLEGNGSGGLVASVKILNERLDQFPSPNQIKTYAFLGGGAFIVVSFVAVVIFRALAS